MNEQQKEGLRHLSLLRETILSLFEENHKSKKRILDLETELRKVYVSLEEDGYTVDWEIIKK